MFEMKPKYSYDAPAPGRGKGRDITGTSCENCFGIPGGYIVPNNDNLGRGREMIMRRTEVIVRRIMPALGKSRDYTYTF